MNTAIIDDREFEFECSVFPLGAKNAILLNKSAVKSLKIQESIFTGWMTGEITIDNQNKTEQSLVTSSSPNSNVLYLKIRDLSTNSLCSDSKIKGNFYIENFFNITKMPSDDQTNLITYTFEDYTYHMIKKIAATKLEKGDRSRAARNVAGRRKKATSGRNGASDSFGRYGDIIKELLIQGLEYEEGEEDKRASVRGKLLNPWDRGKYLYSQQPVQGDEKIFDTIRRIMASYVPNVESIGESGEDVFDLSILYTDRDGNISLTPLSKLLEESIEKPEQYVLELAFIGGGIGTSDVSTANKKIKTDGNSLGELSIITESEFNIRINDKKYIDKFNKVMNKLYSNIGSASGTNYQALLSDFVERLRNYHNKKFVKIFGDKVVSSINFPELPNGGQNSIENVHDYSNNPEIGRNIYGSEIMTNLVLDGYTCKITMRGSLHRTHGKIIEIATTDTSPNADDYKKLGKWFVKTVLHEFTDDKYHNTLECCKTYATDPDSQ